MSAEKQLSTLSDFRDEYCMMLDDRPAQNMRPTIAILSVDEEEGRHDKHDIKKIRSNDNVGMINVNVHHFDVTSKGANDLQDVQDALLQKLNKLNCDDSIDGITLQVAPSLRQTMDINKIVSRICVEKDVSCLNPSNFHTCLTASRNSLGSIQEHHSFVAPYASSVLDFVSEHTGSNLKGKHAVVVGSDVSLGFPVACLLERQGCRVTIVNIHGLSTVKDHLSSADVVVSTVGKQNFITTGMNKSNSIFVDVGSYVANDTEAKIVAAVVNGSVNNARDSNLMQTSTNWIGTRTATNLLQNVLKSYERRKTVVNND